MSQGLIGKVSRANVERGEEAVEPRVGEWFWVGSEEERWLGCVIHVGSNYVELEHAFGQSERVHFNQILERLEAEPEARAYIAEKVAGYQAEAQRLLGEIRAVTARLAINAVTPNGETEALALRGSGTDMAEYQQALSRAKDKTLPELFEAAKAANDRAARWMAAPLIPLRAQAKGMRPAIAAIEQRIFNVELYAGLCEQVAEVRGGAPAPRDTPVHLLQRRAYMDEECLARYETGGMEFADIFAFDTWMARDENLKRLLPHDRCVLSMRVRRNAKERVAVDTLDYFRIQEMADADKRTFLYIRNGEQLYRLSTSIDFGQQLFPDRRLVGDGEPLWLRKGRITDDSLLTQGEYEARCETWDRRDAEKDWHLENPRRTYELYSPDSVFYDDVTARLSEELAAHNRLVVVLQGLLDRSPVLHPHPDWQLWEEAGFAAALRLVHDDSRALVAGAAPDFEAYRQQCNASLQVGSVTVGQEDFWLRLEGERESRRMDNDWRTKSHYRPERWKPYDDPGPGRLARVARLRPRAKDCTYEWEKEAAGKRGWRYGERVRRIVRVPFSEILNVDAYKPGDFRRFFDDPRTRADYLRWAPLLLEAEEYHAGNRKVSGDWA